LHVVLRTHEEEFEGLTIYPVLHMHLFDVAL